MLDFFKERINQKNRLATAILYPDKVIIETYNQLKNSYWIRSSYIKLYPVDIAVSELGASILDHLSKSRVVSRNKSAVTKEEYARITGFKSIKAQMVNSKNVQIGQDDDYISITPTRNGGSSGKNRGYHELEGKKWFRPSKEKIGAEIKDAWEACTF